MKKVMLVMLIIVAMVGTATANTVRQDCGCGLGAVAIGQKEGLVWNLLGTFLNGLCANQTFAMSSGTLDCGPMKKFVQNEKLDIYVADNMDALAIDIATGQGESLSALAEISQVPIEKRARMFTALQQNFDLIYPSADVTHKDVAGKISEIIETI